MHINDIIKCCHSDMPLNEVRKPGENVIVETEIQVWEKSLRDPKSYLAQNSNKGMSAYCAEREFV